MNMEELKALIKAQEEYYANLIAEGISQDNNIIDQLYEYFNLRSDN